MAEVSALRPADNVGLSAGHSAQCSRYRRAYRERNGSLTRAVCCCAELSETPAILPETQRKVPMGDMPCVWCLCFIQAQPFDKITVNAHNPARKEEVYPVAHWAHAESLMGSGFVLRDHNGDRCGMTAATLVSGDAVCLGHAMGVLRARVH